MLQSVTGTTVPKWDGTIFLKWGWHECSQLYLAQLFPSEAGTIVPKWDWAQLFPSETGKLFPSETGTIIPKWDWHSCSQVDFDFVICILFCSLFIGTILHYSDSLVNNPAMYQGYDT